jgi:hypothetical protein
MEKSKVTVVFNKKRGIRIRTYFLQGINLSINDNRFIQMDIKGMKKKENRFNLNNVGKNK